MNKIEIFGVPFLQKGGIHIKNGKPLEKEDSVRLLKVKLRYSGDVSDKKFFNFWDFQKDNSDVADYFNSYINSEGFKRIINNQNKWWEQRHPYRKYYSNPDKGTLRWFDVAEHVEPNRYLAKMSTSLSEAVHIPASEEQRFLIVGTAPTPFYADSTNVEFHPTQSLGHEYAHGKAPFSLFGAPNFHTESALAEALDQNKNTKPGHDSRLLEKHADLWGMRYLFYKEGIYDSRSNEDITIELIQKLRDKYPNLRPFLQMNDELLLFQLNHVAQNNSHSNISYAKSGIKIKEANRGKFTEYCDGKVTQECIDKAKRSGNKKLVKRAVFAENARKWKHQQGGSLYSSGNITESLYRGASKVESLGTPWHNYDFTLSEEWANKHGYFPDERGHRDDRVKKETHPSHPSRGSWNKSGTRFYLSEKGMQDPNHTLFGLSDGGLDPQATLYYKDSIVLPELTVTPKEAYIHNTYDNLKIKFQKNGAKIHKPFGNRSILDNGWIPTKELKKKHDIRTNNTHRQKR